MKTVLLTGANGVLGRYLAQTVDSSQVNLVPVSRSDADLADAQECAALVARVQPDMVIHAAANSNGRLCEDEPDRAYRDNVMSTRNLAVAARLHGCALAYLSGNVVFSGGSKPLPKGYAEYDALSPAGVFAETKAAGERVVTQLVPQHYVLRTAWLFGEGPRRSLVDLIWDGMISGSPIGVNSDIRANPSYAYDVAQAMWTVLASGEFGTYHLAAQDIASPADLAAEIARLAGRSAEDAGTMSSQSAAQPRNLTITNHLAAAQLNVQLPDWRAGVEQYLRDTGRL